MRLIDDLLHIKLYWRDAFITFLIDCCHVFLKHNRGPFLLTFVLHNLGPQSLNWVKFVSLGLKAIIGFNWVEIVSLIGAFNDGLEL